MQAGMPTSHLPIFPSKFDHLLSFSAPIFCVQVILISPCIAHTNSWFIWLFYFANFFFFLLVPTTHRHLFILETLEHHFFKKIPLKMDWDNVYMGIYASLVVSFSPPF